MFFNVLEKFELLTDFFANRKEKRVQKAVIFRFKVYSQRPKSKQRLVRLIDVRISNVRLDRTFGFQTAH